MNECLVDNSRETAFECADGLGLRVAVVDAALHVGAPRTVGQSDLYDRDAVQRGVELPVTAARRLKAAACWGLSARPVGDRRGAGVAREGGLALEAFHSGGFGHDFRSGEWSDAWGGDEPGATRSTDRVMRAVRDTIWSVSSSMSASSERASSAIKPGWGASQECRVARTLIRSQFVGLVCVGSR